MEDELTSLPIVDLGPLNLPHDLVNFDPIKDLTPDDPKVKALAAEVVKAFTDIGFLYLVNHAISETLTDTFNSKTGEFFALPTETKIKYRPSTPEDIQGYHGLLEEKLDEADDVLPDYREFYLVTASKTEVWPEEETPGFKVAVMDLFKCTTKLCHVVLKLMGVGLQLEDPDYFIKMTTIIERQSFTTIRAIHYPPVPNDLAKRPGLLRCGEHSDWGSITLLYQDSVGGLEVMNRKGQYIPATPVEGSVVVNIGDMMQRWTADRFISTKHRVVVPKEDFDVQRPRRSIAFFAFPDDEAIIKCIDNSDKYPPISMYQYTMDKIANTKIGPKGGYK